jgi:hypothetical protein
MRKQHTILLAGVLCAPAFAQRVEIFGGAQFEHLQSSYNAVGWNASLTGNFKHVLGITGDFSGVYNSRGANSSVYTYTVGPVISARLPVVQPFVHALFGGATVTAGGMRDNAFAMLLGAGLDIGFRKGIALRLVQADWLMTKFGNQNQDRQGRRSRRGSACKSCTAPCCRGKVLNLFARGFPKCFQGAEISCVRLTL